MSCVIVFAGGQGWATANSLSKPTSSTQFVPFLPVWTRRRLPFSAPSRRIQPAFATMVRPSCSAIFTIFAVATRVLPDFLPIFVMLLSFCQSLPAWLGRWARRPVQVLGANRLTTIQ